MSGIVNKIKDVLHKDHSTTSSTTHGTTSTTGHGTNNPNSNISSATSGSTNHGGHDSNLANKADPRVDSDRDGSHLPGAHGNSGVSNTHNLAGGSGVTGNSHSTGAYGSNTTSGPHSSDLANKADPRVDSDRSQGLTGNTHNTHNTGHSSGLTGNTHSTGHSSGLTGNNYGNTTTSGPHSSDTANKLDPRVDSDNSKLHSGNNSGLTGTGHSSTHTGTGHSSGLTGTGHSSNTYGSTNAGPHDSNAMNKLDPRVDSDRDGRHAGTGIGSNTHNTGYGSSHTGHSATHGSTNAGPHDSNLANKADPRVDSDLDSTGNRHGANTGGVFGASGSHATSGSGTAQNTSGPHNSDLLNKLDPRVDSDKDGSKTVGGNKTHA